MPDRRPAHSWVFPHVLVATTFVLVWLQALSVSSSNLISIAESGTKSRDRGDNLGMKKSSIDGNQYLDYL
jgi:hypothetical protein